MFLVELPRKTLGLTRVHSSFLPQPENSKVLETLFILESGDSGDSGDSKHFGPLWFLSSLSFQSPEIKAKI